jgi:hypothetical protein
MRSYFPSEYSRWTNRETVFASATETPSFHVVRIVGHERAPGSENEFAGAFSDRDEFESGIRLAAYEREGLLKGPDVVRSAEPFVRRNEHHERLSRFCSGASRRKNPPSASERRIFIAANANGREEKTLSCAFFIFTVEMSSIALVIFPGIFYRFDAGFDFLSGGHFRAVTGFLMRLLPNVLGENFKEREFRRFPEESGFSSRGFQGSVLSRPPRSRVVGACRSSLRSAMPPRRTDSPDPGSRPLS